MNELSSPTISVLIVEDHIVTINGLIAELKDEPDIAIVGSAIDYKSSLQMATDLQPDAVLLDLHLPDSPGPKSLLQSFKAAAPEMKIIVFSGEERQVFIEAVISNGADAFIHKSKPPSVIANRLRELVVHRTGRVVARPLKDGLSPGERDIVKLLAVGMKYADIAASRNTSPETVRKQCDHIQLKLSLASREELIVWAALKGYGSVD